MIFKGFQCPECGERLNVEAQPRERATREYPGSAASAYAEGCEHAEHIPEEDLLEWIVAHLEKAGRENEHT